jgi:hypothetical protein
MEDSQYYSMACMLASAMSNGGNNITFETKHTPFDKSFIIKSKDDQSLARKRFVRLMDILFAKMSIERTLVKEGHSNIYRLNHCLRRLDRHIVRRLELDYWHCMSLSQCTVYIDFLCDSPDHSGIRAPTGNDPAVSFDDLSVDFTGLAFDEEVF